MKKIISIIIISSMLLFCASAHWADEAIDKLSAIGVIEGDATGDFRPDADITRAEFVKIINRYFKFTEKADITFSDVQNTQWYYEEFRIAEKAGYILGDNGKAFPEKTITRAEAAVIVSRVSGISGEPGNVNFTDLKEIPSWAIEAISGLMSKKIISGYPDGSFRASGPISRGEAFSVVSKMEVKADDTTKPENISSSPVIAEPKPSGGGGGGGGGGGISGGGGSAGGTVVDYNLKTPDILRYDKDGETLYWIKTPNASSYTVKIVCEEGSGEYQVPEDSSSLFLGDYYSLLAANSDSASMDFKVTVMANGISPYVSSPYSEEILTKKEFESLAKPDLKIRSGVAGGTKHAIIDWEAISGATEYDVSVNIGETPFGGYVYIPEKREIRFTDLSILGEQSATVSVISVSPDRSVVKNSPVATLTVKQSGTSGSGTKEDPFQIYTAEDFINIRNAPDKAYVLKSSIELPGNYTPCNFKGSLVGDDEKNLKSITINVSGVTSSASAPYGVFAAVSDNVCIKNIRIKGSISVTGGSVGALAGSIVSLSDTAEISNCINEASVTGTDSYTGGFFGNMPSWLGYNGKLEGLINTGTVTGVDSVGGILGIGKVHVDKCANFGNIVGYNHVGGLCGRTYLDGSKITNSYNKGNISSTATAGNIYIAGINGYCGHGTFSVSGCYNTGDIIGAITNKAGIIAGTNNLPVNISNCYSTGNVNGGFHISPAHDKITISNCVYVSAVDIDDSSDGVEQTFPVSDAVFKNIPDEYKAPLSEMGYVAVNGKYPVLKDNPEVTLSDIAEIEYPKNISASFSLGTLTFIWNAPVKTPNGIEVTIFNNSDIIEIGTYQLSPTATSYSIEAEEGKYYEINIKYIYADKESESRVFEYKAE